MNKLSKAQRDRILGIAVATPIVIALLWFFLVQAEQTQLEATQKKAADIRTKLSQAESVMRRGEEISDRLQAHSALLTNREASLAPDRDAYAWIIQTINPFILSRKGVSIYSCSLPDVSDLGLLSNFPYRWATFHLNGTGYYHDFGAFFADFENNFPYFYIQNLAVNANVGPGLEPEKLNFSFDLVTPMVASDTK
jgi:Tfp pilus assembly protein PilO